MARTPPLWLAPPWPAMAPVAPASGSNGSVVGPFQLSELKLKPMGDDRHGGPVSCSALRSGDERGRSSDAAILWWLVVMNLMVVSGGLWWLVVVIPMI